MSLLKDLLKLPNLLSLYRLILSFLFPLLWIKGISTYLIFFLLISAVVSDTLDGNLARLLKQKTKLGKILDPIADKSFINMLFFLLYLEKKFPLKYLLVIFLRDIFIITGSSYLLLKRGYKLQSLSPTLLGKISTVLQLISLVALFTHYYIKTLSLLYLDLILKIAIFFTIGSGFHYLMLFQRLCKHPITIKAK